MNERKNKAAQTIEERLRAAGWAIQDADDLAIPSSGGAAVRNRRLSRDYGMADLLLYVDGKVAGLIEIDADSEALPGIDPQSEKYRRGLPLTLPVHTRPLPFLYQSNGEQIRFTNGFDAEPRARALFAFHKAETLKTWLEEGMIGSLPRDMAAAASIEYGRRGATLQERLWINMPPLDVAGLSPIQFDAITALEQSLRKNRPRVLIQLKDANERRETALHLIDRLLRFAGARRVLLLVNSANIVREVHRAFQAYRSPYNKADLPPVPPVQDVTDRIDTNARVCMTTLPRIHGLLNPSPSLKQTPMQSPEEIFETVAPLRYNAELPIETFDVVLIDTCSAPLTMHFRRVLDYFDAYAIGMTGEADEKTAALFDGNVVGGEEDEGLGVIPKV